MGLFTFQEIQAVCGGEFNRSAELTAEVDEVVTDTRTPMKNALFIALAGERFDAHNYLADAVRNGAALLCVDRNKAEKVPPGATAILVESPLAAYQALAGYYRRRFPELKLAALTGSCGKTSTKEILRAIFEHAAGTGHVLATEGNTNNQIGVPRNLLRLTGEHRYAVIEMGTNHHGEIEPLAEIAAPQTSLIVSIGSCHLEFFVDLNGVASEKSHIFAPESVQDAVFPQECGGNDILRKAASRIPGQYTFGESPESTVQVIYHGGNLEGSSFELIETASRKRIEVQWNLTGRHQALNAGCAAAAALSFGIPLEMIGEAIGNIKLPGFRMRKTRHRFVLWLNDAYNANPDSMCAALNWLSEFADPAHLLLVLGDMGELGKESLKGHMRVIAFAFENL
ncbi:MAG: UDP-N-acetylmuramoyl-tripeptide--D-alanyl-D-alanine ligase, partial [Lentisphaeria bacterium]|nr:UDP-N-acetylmuramoyl-tripeptide--D-alanyl-D-alanine ligase [Lentisphaeria bacterium]